MRHDDNIEVIGQSTTELKPRRNKGPKPDKEWAGQKVIEDGQVFRDWAESRDFDDAIFIGRREAENGTALAIAFLGNDGTQVRMIAHAVRTTMSDQMRAALIHLLLEGGF
jgi:hypothetical protein